MRALRSRLDEVEISRHPPLRTVVRGVRARAQKAVLRIFQLAPGCEAAEVARPSAPLATPISAGLPGSAAEIFTQTASLSAT